MRISTRMLDRRHISIATMAMLICDWHIHYLFNTITGLTGFSIINYIYYLIKYALIAGYIAYTISKVKKSFFYVCAVIGVLLGATLLLYPENRSYIISDLSKMLSNSVWTFFVCCNFRDWDIIDDIVEKSAKLAGIIVGICYPLNTFVFNYRLTDTQYMSMSYVILTGVAGFLYFGIKRGNVKDIFIGIILVAEMFVAGARGPLLCVFAILLVSVIRLLHNNTYKAAGILLFLAILSIVVFANLDNVISTIASFCGKFGIELRLVNMLNAHTMTESTSTIIRSRFQDIMCNNIISNPFGIGIYGDRVLGEKAAIGIGYAHNVIYEILIDYGTVIGGTAILYLTVLLLKRLLIKDAPCEATVDFIMATTLIKLMVSSSYWFESLFFVLIFILIRFRKV